VPNGPRLMKEVGSNMTGRLDPDYEAEVERMTVSREVAYASAQRRLDAAERKAKRLEHRLDTATGKTKRLTKRELATAWEAVEARRAELESLARGMTSTPASAQNRGTKSFRPVPVRHGGNL
jgi:predicted  nucleic acid-binding Zn-ribbon protein